LSLSGDVWNFKSLQGKMTKGSMLLGSMTAGQVLSLAGSFFI
jgi:hypothetical protein